MSKTQAAPFSWQSKFQALGPGILLASAAVGGSHIVASTQAGAIYGWQLAVIIILVNLCKYPFFRFGTQYTLDTGKTLLQGYKEEHPAYLWLFFLFNLFATVLNIAGVSLITAAIVQSVLPVISINILAAAILGSALILLITGRYGALDRLSKLVMTALTAATLTAVAVTAAKGGNMPAPGFVPPSPWSTNVKNIEFMVALMGWMPAPLEFSAINSIWVVAKNSTGKKVSYKDGLFDFHLGYIGTAVLAVLFLALGAMVQYGSGETVEMAGSAYIQQLVNMYARSIGEWSRYLVIFIAFMCMFGTTLTATDGYSRANNEAFRLMNNTPYSSQAQNIWVAVGCAAGMVVILFFKGSLGPMLKVAMVVAFLSAPLFAWLNLLLARKTQHKVTGWLMACSWLGLAYLTGFAVFYLFQLLRTMFA